MRTRDQSRLKGSANTLPRVAIVILNWNGWKDTIECIESLSRIDYTPYDIAIVDNGSTDQSIVKIKEYANRKTNVESVFFEVDHEGSSASLKMYSKSAREAITVEKGDKDSASSRNLVMIKTKRNYGFAEGSNIGIQYVIEELKPDYLLLLNNDVVVDTKFLSEMIKVAESDKEIGILGSKIYYYDFQGRSDIINFAGEDLVIWKAQGKRYGFNEVDKGQYDSLREVDKIDGACMLIRKETLDAVGFFDSAFFAYWEETDFCLRARRKGYRIVYVPTAKIWHKIAASIGGVFNCNRVYYQARNRFLFVQRNVRGFQKMKFLLYFVCYDLWVNIGIFLKSYERARLLFFYVKGVYDGLGILVKL